MKTLTIKELQLISAIFGEDKLLPEEKKRLATYKQEHPVCTPDKCINEPVAKSTER
jgi:hypothetical protein